jgi:hypothetical protein
VWTRWAELKHRVGKVALLSKQADPKLYFRQPANPIFESEQLRVITACFLSLQFPLITQWCSQLSSHFPNAEIWPTGSIPVTYLDVLMSTESYMKQRLFLSRSKRELCSERLKDRTSLTSGYCVRTQHWQKVGFRELLHLYTGWLKKRALQCYSKCYCVASVTKTFTLKGVQTIHCSRCWKVESLYAIKSKHWTVTIPGKTRCSSLHNDIQNTVPVLWINWYKLSKFEALFEIPA